MAQTPSVPTEALGIDIGRVITRGTTDGSAPSIFDEDFLNAQTEPGAFETIEELGEKRYGTDMYLVSLCSPRTQERTRQWLAYQGFYDKTGLPESNVYFCEKFWQKAEFAAHLSLTQYIDDRADILLSMPPEVQTILYIPQADPEKPEPPKPQTKAQRFVEARGWSDVREFLLGPNKLALPTKQ